MVRIIHVVAAGVLLMSATGGFAQNQSEPTSLASGTAVNAQLSRSLDSKKAKPGDVVTAETTEAVKVDGKIVIPNNTKLVGHVTRASARAKGDADSVLAMQFDRAVLKDGHEMPLQVTLQALASEQGTAAVSGDDLQPMGNIEGGAAGAGAAGNRGTVGGVGSTVPGAASGAASTVPRTIDQSGTVNSATGAATGSSGSVAGGLNSSGGLKATSRGVYGLNGLSLNANGANSANGAVILSAGKNVHLDSGTRLLLVTQATTSAAAER